MNGADVSVGRIVHVRRLGMCTPAIVVRHWGAGTVNLRIFDDAPDVPELVTSFMFSEQPADGPYWHWPERV